MKSPDDLEDIDIENLFLKEHIVIIEWADKFLDLLKSYAKNPVVLRFSIYDNNRTLEIEGF